MCFSTYVGGTVMKLHRNTERSWIQSLPFLSVSKQRAPGDNCGRPFETVSGPVGRTAALQTFHHEPSEAVWESQASLQAEGLGAGDSPPPLLSRAAFREDLNSLGSLYLFRVSFLVKSASAATRFSTASRERRTVPNTLMISYTSRIANVESHTCEFEGGSP